MDWKTYEEVTKDIYESLGKQHGVVIEGWGASCIVKGQSGVGHQIDVLTSHSDGLHTYKTDIECKYWNQNIDKDIIMKVEAIVKDCQFNKGIVVSKLGFTPDAIAYAKFVNIGLVILREPTEEDWEGRVRIISLEMNFLTPVITKFQQNVVETYSDFQGGRMDTTQFEYLYTDGKKELVKDVVDRFMKSMTIDNPDDEFSIKFEHDEFFFLVDLSGKKLAKVKSVDIVGRFDSTKQSIEISHEDKVWLMMKSLFEEKTFAIFRDKEVRDIS
jgi:hypothetical protein